jgi:hypothetical protein
LILAAVIFVAMVAKIQHIIKIYQDYGLLTELIVSSFFKVIPFMTIFMLWTSLFAMELYILKSNRSDADSFQGINIGAKYLFLAFSNGIGNI